MDGTFPSTSVSTQIATGHDHVRRGSIGKELVSRLAVQDTTKEELVHGLLDDLGRGDLADELDTHSADRRRLLSELDSLSAGVSALEVLASEGNRFDDVVRQLRDLVSDHLRYEVEKVIPAIRDGVPPDRLAALGDKVESVRRHAPTRPANSARNCRRPSTSSRRPAW